MNRRQALGGIAALTVGTSGVRSARAAIEFVSDGFGLAIDDFVAIWGEGEPGQTYLQYPEDDGTWFIGQTAHGLVNYIERSWNEGLEPSLEDANVVALAIIPEESIENQTYRAKYGAILHGIQIDRFTSSSLADQLGIKRVSEDDFLAETSFVIAYELVPLAAEFDLAVRRFSVVLESDPDSQAS